MTITFPHLLTNIVDISKPLVKNCHSCFSDIFTIPIVFSAKSIQMLQMTNKIWKNGPVYNWHRADPCQNIPRFMIPGAWGVRIAHNTDCLIRHLVLKTPRKIVGVNVERRMAFVHNFVPMGCAAGKIFTKITIFIITNGQTTEKQTFAIMLMTMNWTIDFTLVHQYLHR